MMMLRGPVGLSGDDGVERDGSGESRWELGVAGVPPLTVDFVERTIEDDDKNVEFREEGWA